MSIERRLSIEHGSWALILLRWGGAFLAAALPAVLTSPLDAQQTGAIAGQITDATSGQPIPAVQVYIPGTTFEALTGAEGSYSLDNVPAGPVEVRVQRLGYTPASRAVQVSAGAVVTEDFQLIVSAVALDALVVTATGVQRRRELGNATSTLQVQLELERIAPASVASLLQGRVPGVQILQSSGTVGGSGTVKIRGNSSITLNNTPLIYIDGARVSNSMNSGPAVGGQTTSRLNDLNPDDIESIEVVKGPSAATLYGVEASAGVILITTRRGRSGTNEWTFRSELGSRWDDTDWPDNVFNPRAFLPPETFGAAVPDTLYRMNLLEQVGTGLDPWRTGSEQAYSASLQGGVDRVTYFLSGELGRSEGVLANNEARQRSVRGNFNLTPSDNVDIAVSTGFGSHTVTLPDNDNNGAGYIGVAMIGSPWELPIRRNDPATGASDVLTCPIDFEYSRLFGVPLGTGWECQDNPFFSERTFDDVATLLNEQKIERFTGSSTVTWRPLDLLTARGTLGYDQFSDQTGSLVPVDPTLPFDDLSRGFRSISNVVSRQLTVEGSLVAGYDLTPDLRSTTSVGAQFVRVHSESASATGRILPAGTSSVSSAVRTQGFESVGEIRSLGLFVQQQLGWRDRVFLTPAVRMDQNSAFGERLGREAYPRVMVSWVVSEEDWFPIAQLDMLRLRGAWGESGQLPPTLASRRTLSANRVTFRNEDVAGLSIASPGNPDLEPARGQEVELGFEAQALEGRLSVDLTWFDQTTKNDLVARDLAPSTGFPGRQWTNIGESNRSGVELGLYVVPLSTPDLRWDWQLNIASVKEVITELENPIPFGLDGTSQRHQEGRPYGAYWSMDYRIDEAGDVVPVADTAIYVGHPTPELEGSVSSSVTLFGWVTLHGNLGFARGFQLFNSTQEFRCGYLGGGTYGGICPEIFETGTDGGRTDMARIKARAAEDGQFAPWVEDADFMRLRTVSLRFDFPQRWLQTVGASRASFTLAGENLALWTNYTGLDPEVNFAGGSQSTRAEFLTLPPTKRVSGRLSVTF